MKGERHIVNRKILIFDCYNDYYRGEVGVYPYFAYGESVRMCIIPVTKKVINSYKKRGVKIHKF